MVRRAITSGVFAGVRRRLRVSAFAAIAGAVGSLFLACVGDVAVPSSPPKQGALGGACYGNGSCDPGLACSPSSLCEPSDGAVEPHPDGGGPFPDASTDSPSPDSAQQIDCGTIKNNLAFQKLACGSDTLCISPTSGLVCAVNLSACTGAGVANCGSNADCPGQLCCYQRQPSGSSCSVSDTTFAGTQCETSCKTPYEESICTTSADCKGGAHCATLTTVSPYTPTFGVCTP